MSSVLLLCLYFSHFLTSSSYPPITGAGLLPNGCGQWGYHAFTVFPDGNTTGEYVPLNVCQSSGTNGVECGPSYIWQCDKTGSQTCYYQCWDCTCSTPATNPSCGLIGCGRFDGFECGGPSCAIVWREGCGYAGSCYSDQTWGDQIYVYGACGGGTKGNKRQTWWDGYEYTCTNNSLISTVWNWDTNYTQVENCPSENTNVNVTEIKDVCGNDIGPDCYYQTVQCNIPPEVFKK